MTTRNCKACAHRGTIKYAGGVVVCDLHHQRVSLGHVCAHFEQDNPSKPKHLVKSRNVQQLRRMLPEGVKL